MSNTDKVFAGSIPKLYDTYLVQLIFEPYAMDLANRLASRSVTRVLEIAAGTGVAAEAITKRFGTGAVDGKIQVHIVTIES